MENQISEVNLKPCFISTLLFTLFVVLLYISVQLSTELDQVSEMVVTINIIDKTSLDYSAE